jgi:CheY-like chemotaxis protein
MAMHARILVADDDPGLLAAVADAFEQLGAEVVRARSGGELIERIGEEGPFDLVVSDIAMPWMSGLQALHSARVIGLATPMILITALSDARVPDQVRALGAHAVLLRKPFALGELEAAATQLLAATREAHEPGSHP